MKLPEATFLLHFDSKCFVLAYRIGITFKTGRFCGKLTPDPPLLYWFPIGVVSRFSGVNRLIRFFVIHYVIVVANLGYSAMSLTYRLSCINSTASTGECLIFLRLHPMLCFWRYVFISKAHLSSAFCTNTQILVHHRHSKIDTGSIKNHYMRHVG